MSFGQRSRAALRRLPLRLHQLEEAIMDVVWSRGWDAFSVAEVRDALAGERDLAYTTVMTTIVRLHGKGMLTRRREGRRYLYAPRLSREEFLEWTARRVLDASVGSVGAMALLVDKVSEASATELDRLEALIRQRREELAK